MSTLAQASFDFVAAPEMPRHNGPAYYAGTPRVSSGYMTPAEYANEFRHIARLMPDDAPEAQRPCDALTQRASAIDAGQVRLDRHFRVIVPSRRRDANGREEVIDLSYPCTGCALYTFDEAWLLMEAFAARRGWSDGHRMDVSAEGSGQNLTLGILYDGIADPMRPRRDA